MSTGTSKVIDSLHHTIDELTLRITQLTSENSELKHQKSISTKRIETLIEQLSNAKHQAEVAESLLKRKERRVIDLDLQLTDTLNNLGNSNFELQNLKNQMTSLQSKEKSLISENELFKTQYDSLTIILREFKDEKEIEIDELRTSLKKLINSNENTLLDNINLIKSKEPEIILNYEKVVQSNKRLESLYSEKQDLLVEELDKLANATIIHGNSTGLVLKECEDILMESGKLDGLNEKLSSLKSKTITGEMDGHDEVDEDLDTTIDDTSNEDDDQEEVSNTSRVDSLDENKTRSHKSLSLGIPITLVASDDAVADVPDAQKILNVSKRNGRQQSRSRNSSGQGNSNSPDQGLERRISTKRSQRHNSNNNSNNHNTNSNCNGSNNHTTNVNNNTNSNTNSNTNNNRSRKSSRNSINMNRNVSNKSNRSRNASGASVYIPKHHTTVAATSE